MFGTEEFRIVVNYTDDIDALAAVATKIKNFGVEIYDLVTTDIVKTGTNEVVWKCYGFCCRANPIAFWLIKRSWFHQEIVWEGYPTLM